MYPLFENDEQGIRVARQALDEVRIFLPKRTGSTSTDGTDDKDLALQFQFESLEDTLKVVTDACYARSLAETGDAQRCRSKTNTEVLQSIVATARGLASANAPVPSPSGRGDDSWATGRLEIAGVGSRPCGSIELESSTPRTNYLVLSDDSPPESPSATLRRANAFRLIRPDHKRSSSSGMDSNQEWLWDDPDVAVGSDIAKRLQTLSRTDQFKQSLVNDDQPTRMPSVRKSEGKVREGPRLETTESRKSDRGDPVLYRISPGIIGVTFESPRQPSLSLKRAGKRRETLPEANSSSSTSKKDHDAAALKRSSHATESSVSGSAPLANKKSSRSLVDATPRSSIYLPPRKSSLQIVESEDDHTPAFIKLLQQLEELHGSDAEPAAGPSGLRPRTTDSGTSANSVTPARPATPQVPRSLNTARASRRLTVPIRTPPPRTRSTRSIRCPSLPIEPKTTCTACGDRFPLSAKHLKTPCGHTYCEECAVNLVEAHNKQESLYPLRCCANTPIPNSLIEPFLNPTQIAQFYRKIREYQTPHRRRVYCPGKGCSQFVKLGKIEIYFRRTLVCPACTTSICVPCREITHPGSKCNINDLNTIRFTRLVKDKGWQKCPNCHRVVERTEGCLHMTCLCRFEFCYQCGAKSGTKCGHGIF